MTDRNSDIEQDRLAPCPDETACEANERNVEEREASFCGSDLQDALTDAATTLAGIAEALAYRTATDSDDLLEFLASAAESQAKALREIVERAE